MRHQYTTDVPLFSSGLPSLTRPELGIELVKIRMTLKGIEKPGDKSASSSSLASVDKLRLACKSFISSVSRKLGQWYPFLRGDRVSTL
ncbi:hypothetical protein Vadar_028304 [Vaccinium darrowii]|uniref:Uncharacterized protein n=1 Tax=Vaccinium darrowii TaxID=229202 RepID=A0ACB7YHV4_9ERIC|nr:hypothetical protein Vadar_028304 [Vaccinium darrowii]